MKNEKKVIKNHILCQLSSYLNRY